MSKQSTTQGVQHAPYPLMRVSTCGECMLERRVPPTTVGEPFPVYEQVASSAWSSRGPALTLFKVLLCCPGRRASRDTLVDAIWPGEKGATINTERALLAAASVLRTILHTKDEESLLLTTTGSDGLSYRLAAESELWVDVDAFETFLHQATKTKAPEEALTHWEAAYQLTHGIFLPDDLFSEWSQVRRRRLEGNRRLCVHRLAALYSERNRFDEAEVILRTFWTENPTDEDALRRLMSLLARQERDDEALALYEQAEQALSEDGLRPNARTQDLAASLRHRLPVQKQVLQQPLDIPLSQGNTNTLNILPSASSPFLLEQQESFWLTSGTSYLGQLFTHGWSMDGLLDSLEIVLQGVQVMPVNMQRQLLQAAPPFIVTGFPTGVGMHISEEERAILCERLGKSIGDSWRRFHSADAAQLLAVGQFLLFLVQQNHFILYPHVRSTFYSTIYMLIGATLYVLGRYEEAQNSLEKSYITSLESANAWLVAQVASWQAYVYEAFGQHTSAIQATDRALRVISHQEGLENLRLRVRLLTLSAEISANLQDAIAVKKKLAIAEKLVEHLSTPHEEFDQVSWLQHTGTCALNLGQYSVAVQQLQQALDDLPPQWKLRYIATSISLVKALIHTKELKKAVEVSEKTLPLIKSVQAKVFAHKLMGYLQTDLIETFPHERFCQTFVTEVRQQLGVL